LRQEFLRDDEITFKAAGYSIYQHLYKPAIKVSPEQLLGAKFLAICRKSPNLANK
jgi:hypothetical protein